MKILLPISVCTIVIITEIALGQYNNKPSAVSGAIVGAIAGTYSYPVLRAQPIPVTRPTPTPHSKPIDNPEDPETLAPVE